MAYADASAFICEAQIVVLRQPGAALKGVFYWAYALSPTTVTTAGRTRTWGRGGEFGWWHHVLPVSALPDTDHLLRTSKRNMHGRQSRGSTNPSAKHKKRKPSLRIFGLVRSSDNPYFCARVCRECFSVVLNTRRILAADFANLTVRRFTMDVMTNKKQNQRR